MPGLECLKLNDSVINCFRDIGTSFKNVKVLHIARCEIREVQGIQAFKQLEELYVSFNEIDDLFDISFLHKLTVLDFEGNNVAKPEHLNYLRRLEALEDVNFKQNPVKTNDSRKYYDLIEASCPQLVTLDDEDVGQGFFDQKRASVITQKAPQTENDLVLRFANLGLEIDLKPEFD